MYILNYCFFVPISIFMLIMAFNEKLRSRILNHEGIRRLEAFLGNLDRLYWLAFILCMAVGIFARVYRFLELPKGTNQDGVMGALQSYYLLKDGIDTSGESWPVYFEAWKYTNMSTLYSWILMPFIYFLGNTILALRLPMLMISLLMLPLLWDMGRRIGGKGFGLLVLFLAATNPWQILQSRWAIDANLCSHVFLIAFYFLYLGLEKKSFLYLSMVMFGLCVYAYGLAAFLVPAFLIPAAVYLCASRKVSIPELILCIILFAGVSFCYYWMLAINAFDLETVYLGPITIPRIKLTQRGGDVAILQPDGVMSVADNIDGVFNLIFQLDTYIIAYDAIPFANTLYRFMSVFVPIGFFWLWKTRRQIVLEKSDVSLRTSSLLLMAWFVAAVFAALQPGITIMRGNYLFYSLIILAAVAIYEMGKRLRFTGFLTVVMVLINFTVFEITYFTDAEYQDEVGLSFRSGMFNAFQDTWDWDYDEYVIGIASGTEQTQIEPTLRYVHHVDYAAYNEETFLTGPDGELTDWYYTERYVYVTDPKSYEPDPMACSVYVMNKALYADKFNDEDYLVTDYDQFIVAYPRYWAE